ncbi:hypothetical protein [Caulobacter sp. FWC2]|uniref:hypothetical protein n=1 Tax=Caulobacter sp. FWC2 TaxID=69664 RepID=UPI001177E10F|nr:hypothetical protein [Caulobacter sp. FWC2]
MANRHGNVIIDLGMVAARMSILRHIIIEAIILVRYSVVDWRLKPRQASKKPVGALADRE